MNYYFLGIGGIGMSALARFFKQQGHEVSGYDLTPSPLTQQLQREGIGVHYADDPSQIPCKVDLCVYTPAVPHTLSEYRCIVERGIPMHKRAEVLGQISAATRCVAVAGSHGKTTISTMIAHLLHHAQMPCSAFLGGISKDLGSNLLSQRDSSYVVVEADEFDRSFLQLHPFYTVITSTDPDHLDTYGTYEAMLDAFAQYAALTPVEGHVFIKRESKLYQSLAGNNNLQQLGVASRATYSVDNTDADYYASHVEVSDGYITFTLHTPHASYDGMRLNHCGYYNVENAVVASAVALCCGIDEQALRDGLSSFAGVVRRFDYRFMSPQQVFIDDYAHHPAELASAIRSARMLHPGKRLVGIFQPHLYSRTLNFADEFAAVLSSLDCCVLLPIYPAREFPIEGVTSQMLFDKMTLSDKYLVEKDQLLDLLPQLHADVLMTLGAGDIDRLVPQIEHQLESR